MNQAELIAAVADTADVSKSVVETVLKATGETVQSALAGGDEVILPGIGKLKVKQTNARTGRNPKTGEEIEIPARNKPVFTAAKVLKAAVDA